MERQVTYTDPDGRRFEVLIPADAPDAHAAMGIPLGPPDLEDLGLPLDVEVRLNNQLHARGLITARDVHRREDEVVRAIAAALRVSASAIIDRYPKLTHPSMLTPVRKRR